MIDQHQGAGSQSGENVQRIAAIPTVYAGVQFRSRLEAKWAAFFDLLQWQWDYEPMDLEGYIPDFVLNFPLSPLLVEVKPFARIDDLHPAADKIDSTSWAKEALVVGALLGFQSPYDVQPTIGLHGETAEIGWGREDGPIRLWEEGKLFLCDHCRRPSVLNFCFSFRCSVCGRHDGDGHIRSIENLRQLWGKAGNAVQWRKPT